MPPHQPITRSPRWVLALRAAWLVGSLLAVAGTLLALGDWALPPAFRTGGIQSLADVLERTVLYGAIGVGFGGAYGALVPAPTAARPQQRRAGLLAGGGVAVGLAVVLITRIGPSASLRSPLAILLLACGLGLGAWAGPHVHRVLHRGLRSAT